MNAIKVQSLLLNNYSLTPPKQLYLGIINLDFGEIKLDMYDIHED